MATIQIRLNGESVTLTGDEDRLLLWILRTDFALTGAKYGCGEGLCGACTVLVNGEAVLSCQTAVKDVAGAEIVTIEGCIIMGLGYVLREEVRFSGGKIFDENFDTYALPRFSWLPEIETVLVDNPAMPPQGCGEPAITPMGAVIANAVYDAIGVRLYELPMTPARVKNALKSHSDSKSTFEMER